MFCLIRLFRVERDDWQMLLADGHIRCSRALDVTIQREQFPKSKDPLIIWAGPIIMRVTLARYSGPAPVEQIEKYVANGGYVIVMVKRAGVPQHWVRKGTGPKPLTSPCLRRRWTNGRRGTEPTG
jgi:hypothetical protein